MDGLKQISISISEKEFKELGSLAESRGLTIEKMGHRAIQAFLHAMRLQKRKVLRRSREK